MISEMPRRVPGHLAGLAEQRDRHLLFRARKPIRRRHVLRLDRKIRHPQPIVQERDRVFTSNVQRHVVLDGVADRHQPVRQPVAQAVAVEQRHHHVDIGLELDQPFARIGDRALADAGKLHAIMLLERLRQRDEIVRVHLHAVGMALIADQLVADARESCRPPRAGQ